ncbi:MAG: AraC family transcriptional regulator [Devosia sp.]|uniref:AraC family transcriptional regulator n=1 Tax=Devosia sp. TaxID=1871048 RepID=UPI001AC8E88F|nr:AraC family transcriptional regulator [Devosia sp.]MBN9317211.1 AraC family transcriptional regulator [Devosia sp.]
MLGSQILDLNSSITGADIGVPEIKTFGFASFQKAMATTDSWSSHNGPELVFVIEGEACWELENEALIPVSGGQFALFPANKKHRIVNGLYPPSQSFWIVMAGAGQIADPALLTSDGFRDFQNYLGCRGLTHDIEPRCLDAISELGRLVADPRIYTGSSLLIAEMRAALHTVLIEAWKAQDKKLADRSNSELVDEFLEVLHSNPDADLNISEVASRLGFSRSYLHNRFRKEVGMSPSDYAQRLRIKRCCSKLATTDEPVTDIAIEFGFGSSQYFSRVFKKYLGTTPSEYRQQMLIREH